MFIINCPHCDAQQLVTPTHIQSIHRTSEGMVGYVLCAGGHTIVHSFADAYPTPEPPASVIALRQEMQTQAASQKADRKGDALASERGVRRTA